MRLGASGDFLMPDMNPIDLSVTADGIRQTIEAVTDDAVDALDTGRCQDLNELVNNVLGRHCASSTFVGKGLLTADGRSSKRIGIEHLLPLQVQGASERG